MKHFISIVIDNDGINESRDFVLDTVLNTANIGLLENTMEYEIYESENNTQVLSIPIARELNEKQQAYLAKKLANKLFDKGYNNSDIEFSINESTLNEADPEAVAAVARTDDRGRSRIGTDAGDGLVWIVGNTNALVRVRPNDPRVAAQQAAIAPTTTPAAGNAPAAGNSTLRKGSRGEAVRKLQLDLGVQPADGVFGPATEAAVKDFQQRMMPGEAADGIVGPKTNTAIQQSAAIDTGDNPEIEKSDPNSQFAALSGFATSRRGGIANNPSQVDAIKELQAELKRREIYAGEVDGKYGPQTRAAVTEFQKQNDLYVDGDAGPRTIQKLMQREDPNITMTPLDEPQDQAASGGRLSGADQIDVDNNQDDSPSNDSPSNERIQGALPQDIIDQYTQYNQTKDYIAMLRLVDQYQYLYDRFNARPNPATGGEGTMYDWLTAKAADDSSDFAQDAVDTVDRIPAPQGELSATDQAQTGTDAGADDEQQTAAQPETGVDWEELNPNAAPEGYTLFIKRQNPPAFTYGKAGGEPADTEYASQREAIAAVREIADGQQAASSADDEQQAAQSTEGPYKEGDEITDDIAAKLETLGIDPGMGGEPMNQEDADALNKGVADGTIQGPATELEILDNQPRGYGMDQGKVIVRRGERYFDVDVSRTRNFNGSAKYRGSSLPGYEHDPSNPQAPSRVNADAVYFSPEDFEGTETNTQRVDPRPTESGVQGDYARNDWDTRYGETHNPDGTLKTTNNESVEPMPKGVFMVEDRAIWRSLYESTHYTNGKPRPRTFITESKMQEVTFDDDDKFFEAYGVMWFNEDETIDEAEYQGRKVKLGKPMAGDVKKFKVYVKNPKGNVVKVNFGQKGAKIKKNNPERRRSFRARHNCDNPGPRHKARYWSCRKW